MTVLIVEDDLPAQRRLVRLVRAHPLYQDASVVCAEQLTEARRILESTRIELVLLDLDLHGQDGFLVLSAAIDASTQVVVVSAHTERALEAFEVGVVDFVEKPVNEARLMLALGRALPSATGGRPAEVLVRSRQGLERVPVEQIVHIIGADDYVEVVLTTGRRLLHDESITKLERRLPSGFVRVHRSHIVRRDAVQRVLDGQAGSRVLQLSNGSRVPVSRRRAATVLRALRGLEGE